MAWSEKTQEALKAWLAPSTAHEGNSDDDSRFYEFIFDVWIDESRIWDERLASQRMKKEAKLQHDDWQSSMIDSFIEKRRSQGSLILDFLNSVKKKGLMPKLASFS